MAQKCNFIEGCPIFRYFSRMSEVVYRMAYCEGDYHTCARHQLRTSGQPVPVNLGPQGTKLWPDGAPPPAELNLPGM